MSLLQVDGVSVSYGQSRALDGVSLRVEAGEIVALVGANGAGKSTLMRAIMRLVAPNAGTVVYDGQSLTVLRTHRIARMGIAYVPEGRGVLRQLSVRENLILGAYGCRDQSMRGEKLQRVLARFPILAEKINQSAGSLSGGQQQMLVIGRALMAEPKLLLLDEPSLGLAPLIAEDIFKIVADLAKGGVTVLLVEQNALAALKLANRAYVLETGRIVLEGDDLLANPRVRDAYLGEFGVDEGQAPTLLDAAGSRTNFIQN
jgi:branched-chain amino acid transport system ATP-binding protein